MLCTNLGVDAIILAVHVREANEILIIHVEHHHWVGRGHEYLLSSVNGIKVFSFSGVRLQSMQTLTLVFTTTTTEQISTISHTIVVFEIIEGRCAKYDHNVI